MEESPPVGVHLVGSVPLGSAEEVFRSVADALGDRIRRLPDGETGARSDWIVWQYPLFSSRPQFEIGPPGASSYRALPQLRLRTGEDASGMAFEELGYASAAMESYRTFSRLKRDGEIPPGCRFLVSLPTPLAPVSAFVALEYQAELEPVYEAQMRKEVERILAAIPADQLAIQWDARYEFAMLEGAIAVWFEDVRAGIVERLLRLARMVPPQVELGFHLCYGDDEHGHFAEPEDAGKLVGVANALAATLDRPLNWIHMPVPQERDDDRYYAPLGDLRLGGETELYLGLIHAGDRDEGAQRRIAAAREHVEDFGIATECGWGRGGAAAVTGLLALHRGLSAPLPDGDGPRPGAHAFAWPEGFVQVPEEDWTNRDVDEAGIAYDHVDAHGWYRNLDLTVEELAGTLRDGDLLLDYSGGTGILLDRLRLRVFDRRVGVVIVDASAKFLRVALEKYQDDPLVALRLLRYLKDERRLQTLDEVLDLEFDALACTNAIHLYPDLDATLGTLEGRAAARRRRVHQLGQHPQPARQARRVDPRRDGVGDQRPRRGARALRPAVRALPRGGRRRRAHEGARRVPRPRVRGAAAARLLPAGADRRRLRGARRARGDDRGARERVVRVPQRLPLRRAGLGGRPGSHARRAPRPPAPDPPRDGDAVRRAPVVQRLLDLHHSARADVALLTGAVVSLARCLRPHGR